VVDWPVTAGLTCGELNDFFQWAEHVNDYHPEVMDTESSNVAKGYHLLRYQTKAYEERTKSLRVFNEDEREFLECYRWLRHVPEFFMPQDLFSELIKLRPRNRLYKIYKTSSFTMKVFAVQTLAHCKSWSLM
jgi:hypothetical protein